MNKDNEVVAEKTHCSRLCPGCKGSGLIEMPDSDRCPNCMDLRIWGCIKCKGGYLYHPYETCVTCDGRGNLTDKNCV